MLRKLSNGEKQAQRRERQQQEEQQRIAREVEYSRNELPTSVLFALARAEQLGLDYHIDLVNGANAIEVKVVANEVDLGYPDDVTITIYGSPDKDYYTHQQPLLDLINLNNRVAAYKMEKARLAELRLTALNKLTPEEKVVLGLQ